jgi:hypothetical protein
MSGRVFSFRSDFSRWSAGCTDLQLLRLVPGAGLLCRFNPIDKRRNLLRIDARHNSETVLLQAFGDNGER